VRPGQTVALVGRTGSGKTTLLSLVPRLYEPTSGVVRIDNQDIRELTLKSLRDQVAVVPQDGMLFGGSIRENIAYGKPEATDREIEAATRAAQIHDFINRLPDGYDTAVGERGVTLSGGQRQRLALARAIVKDAPIVLLDEPTTGLDTESEQLVVRALEHLLRGRTALVIAHRLSTITTADLILVMVEGRIAQQGRHEDLLEQEGPYRDLYELQFAARQSTTGHRLARAG
jgi:ABC-type multidrug transport system fused ATPase/permease subunit